MYSKKKILGIRCEINICDELEHDENLVLVGGTKLILKKRHIGFLLPIEKFAVMGESPFFIKGSSFLGFFGPNVRNDFLLRINSRGCLREIVVPDRDVLFL